MNAPGDSLDEPLHPGGDGPNGSPVSRANGPPGADPSRGPPRWARKLLAVPLFFKILIANAVIVAGGAAAAALIAATRLTEGASFREVLELEVLGMLAGIVLATATASILINALILRLALRPIRELEETAERVRSGDLEARAHPPAVSDPDLERLAETFNGMLDVLSSYRRRLQGIATTALRAQEAERRRIARELHDDTAQTLASLLVGLRLLDSVRGPEERQTRIEELRQQITDAMESVRRFARGLRPPALDELGLIPALNAYAREMADIGGVEIVVDSRDVPPRRITPDVELALYRIVQEALSNVVRHAQAKHARVHMQLEDSLLLVTVEDDGRGFDPAGVDKDNTLGLFGMRERATYVGGDIAIDSRPGAGTRVRIRIPLGEDAQHAGPPPVPPSRFGLGRGRGGTAGDRDGFGPSGGYEPEPDAPDGAKPGDASTSSPPSATRFEGRSAPAQTGGSAPTSP